MQLFSTFRRTGCEGVGKGDDALGAGGRVFWKIRIGFDDVFYGLEVGR